MSKNDKILQLSTVQLGQALLQFKGSAFSLNGYRPFEEVYNMDPSSMVVKCSRQVNLSLGI